MFIKVKIYVHYSVLKAQGLKNEFSAKTGGHIKVTGRLNNKNAFGYTQEISFENEIDQTYLREFVNQLLADFGKYAD